MDGLRAFACLTVFLANLHHSMGTPVSGHLGPFDLAYFAESGIGVAILIVMSGALIGLPFWARLEPHAGRTSWTAFVMRRVIRLAPAYYACLLLYLGLSGHSVGVRNAVAHFLFVNNLWEASFYDISPQFWTIGMFAQFYLVIPLLVIGLRIFRLRGRAAAVAVLILSAGSYLLHSVLMATRSAWLAWPLSALASADGVVLSHSPLAHLPQFFMGVATGYVLHELTGHSDAAPGTAGRRKTTALAGASADVVFWSCAGAALILASAPALSGLELPYGRYLFPFLTVPIAVAMIAVQSAPLGRAVLELPPIRALGRISYGVYLYHMLCLTAVARLWPGPIDAAAGKLTFASIAFALTACVATASYLLLERPLLRWSRQRLIV